MDTTIGVGGVAEMLGISAPAVRRLADRLGIKPLSTPGGHRRFRPADVRAMVAEAGAAPRITGRSRSEVRVLAALAGHPLGFTSVRALSRASGVAPSAAMRALQRLEQDALVRVKDEYIADGGVARASRRWQIRPGDAWGAIAGAVASTVLPVTTSEPTRAVPRRFWHLFWNADPSKLRIDRDADYIATRMLLSPELEATGWALSHLAPEALRAAARNRAADVYVRATVRNALAS